MQTIRYQELLIQAVNGSHVTLSKVDGFIATVYCAGTSQRELIRLVTVVIATESLRVVIVLGHWIHVYLEVAVSWTVTGVVRSYRRSRRHYYLQTVSVKTDIDSRLAFSRGRLSSSRPRPRSRLRCSVLWVRFSSFSFSNSYEHGNLVVVICQMPKLYLYSILL